MKYKPMPTLAATPAGSRLEQSEPFIHPMPPLNADAMQYNMSCAPRGFISKNFYKVISSL